LNGAPKYDANPAAVKERGVKLKNGGNIAAQSACQLFAAQTPKPVIDSVNKAVREVLADPRFTKGWDETGVRGYLDSEQTPDALAALVRSEVMRWADVIRENRIEASN
jgi:tripartite-type tricarboxylate transporter receptor subunit TctC